VSPMRGAEASDPMDQSSTISNARSNDASVIPIGPVRELPPNVVPLRPRQGSPVSSVEPQEQPVPIFGTAAWHLPQWPLILVLSGIALGMLVVMIDSFRRGVLVMAGSLVLAFFLRLVLTDRDAGMLKVRNRVIDAFVLGSFAVALVVFALWVPAPS